MQHLHSRGLAHGDLYAHNILWKRLRASDRAGESGGSEGRHHAQGRVHRGGGGGGGAGSNDSTEAGTAALAKLSDFGAAFYYGEGARALGVHYERMEQRAYAPSLTANCQRG